MQELKVNTFQSTKSVERKGRKHRVFKGQPNVGQEGCVATIRKELKARRDRAK
jgi:hypothetical protein